MKSKEQKRIEAEVRQEEHDALSLEEKVAKIRARPGMSGREARRFFDQMRA